VSQSAAQWCSTRVATVPGALGEAMQREVSTAPDESRVFATLAAAGCRALERAVERSGRRPETALDLLVADAFLTYACEAAAVEAEDVAAALTDVLVRVSEVESWA